MFFDPFSPPRYIFDKSEDNKHFLGNLHATPSDNRLWLQVSAEIRKRVFEAAGLDHQDVQRRGECASFYVELFPELKEALASNMIYGQPSRELYYLELFQSQSDPSQYRMISKYQTILGFRFMFCPTAEFVDAMVAEMAAVLKVERGDLFTRGPKPPQVPARSLAAPQQTAVATTEQDELQTLLLDGDVIRLPEQHLRHYARIKLAIEKAGGSYNAGGYFSFLAGINAGEVLKQLQSGMSLHVKKDNQFYATPADLARTVVSAVGHLAGKRVLEPSAGDGALADLARAAGADVVTIENWNVNVLKLQAKGYNVMERDFLTVTPEEIGLFDAIVANPPFSRGMDMKHVEHMLKFLKPGGTLSVLTSTSWEAGSQRRQAAFRQMLEEHKAYIERVAPGAFKSSGTQVGALHITLTMSQQLETASAGDQLPLAA